MSKKKVSVLVIEDDSQDFILINQALRSSPRLEYQTHHAKTYEEALRLVIEDNFDVILLDYFLGDETGFDLLRRAREERIDKPIIVMTGGTAVELDDMLIKAGAADFIPKDEISSGFLDRTIRHAIERKLSEKEIAQLVRRDALTGLGNRYIFEEHMESAIARAERSGTRLGVIFMDLDRFKDVNDSLGHHVGDLLLALVGDRLRRIVRKSDFIARIGGDEFTVLLDNVSGYEDVEKIVRKILDGVSQPAPVSNTTLDVSVSIGVAMYPDNGELGIELMQKADMALYESKALGPGNYHFFTESLQQRLVESLEIEKGLRQAIANDELELYYQPQVDLQNSAVVGLEALVRWNHPERGLVPPDEFIPVATRCGLIIPLGEWVLSAACRQLQNWHEQGLKVPVSVNVSPRQLKQQGFISNLLALKESCRIPAGKLEIELTEEVFIETSVIDLQTFEHVRNCGVHVSIDDFGTGFSSMRYLKDIPLDRIKIDRCFISQNGSTGVTEPAITKAIISLASGLHLDLVAEGVETEQQSLELLSMGCRFGQGYHFFRPMPVDQVTEVLRQRLAPELNEPGS